MHPVKRLRAEQRLSLRDLSERSGVPPGAISGIERGTREPQARTLARLADGLGVSIGDLDPKAPAPQRSGQPEKQTVGAELSLRWSLEELLLNAMRRARQGEDEREVAREVAREIEEQRAS